MLSITIAVIIACVGMLAAYFYKSALDAAWAAGRADSLRYTDHQYAQGFMTAWAYRKGHRSVVEG